MGSPKQKESKADIHKFTTSGFAFLTLGLLIGSLIGLSSQNLAQSVMALLFAFGGGTSIAFIRKLSSREQYFAGLAVLLLSSGSLIGLYSGIIISEHQLLSPKEIRENRLSVEERKYLRNELSSKAQRVDILLQDPNNAMTLEAAYDSLYNYMTLEEK